MRPTWGEIMSEAGEFTSVK